MKFQITNIKTIISLGFVVKMLVGCAKDSSVLDGAVSQDSTAKDISLFDVQHDLGTEDAAVDMVQTDTGITDLGDDADSTDGNVTDGSLSDAIVLYGMTNAPNSYGLRTVIANAASAPALVPSWGGLIDFEPIVLSGFRDSLEFDPRRPRVMQDPQFPGVVLPNGDGRLFSFHRTLTGTSGLLWITGQGKMISLVEVLGLYPDTIAAKVALSSDAKDGAVVVEGKRLWLFHLPGVSNVTTIASEIVFTPSLITIDIDSVTIIGDWVFGVATTSTGERGLFRVRRDGSEAPTMLTFPTTSGNPVLGFMDSALTVNRTGTYFVLRAGSDPNSVNLYRVDVQSGQVDVMTQALSPILSRGEAWGQSEGFLALSPNGNRVAFVRSVQGLYELYVAERSPSRRRRSGSIKEIHLSHTLYFDIQVGSFFNLHFADDDNLLFMAGSDGQHQSIFRWTAVNDTVSEVTSPSGSTTSPPFKGTGSYLPRVGWRNASGKWIYYVVLQPSPTGLWEQNLVGIDTTTFTAQYVTSAMDVSQTASDIALCSSTEEVYFLARVDVTKNQDEVWRFNQSQGTPATPITQGSAPGDVAWRMKELKLNAPCDRLIWTAGSTDDERTVWTVTLSSTGTPTSKPTSVTTVPQFIQPGILFTPDGVSIVYGSGGGDKNTTLKAASIYGGLIKTLDPIGGVVQPIVVY